MKYESGLPKQRSLLTAVYAYTPGCEKSMAEKNKLSHGAWDSGVWVNNHPVILFSAFLRSFILFFAPRRSRLCESNLRNWTPYSSVG